MASLLWVRGGGGALVAMPARCSRPFVMNRWSASLSRPCCWVGCNIMTGSQGRRQVEEEWMAEKRMCLVIWKSVFWTRQPPFPPHLPLQRPYHPRRISLPDRQGVAMICPSHSSLPMIVSCWCG